MGSYQDPGLCSCSIYFLIISIWREPAWDMAIKLFVQPTPFNKLFRSWNANWYRPRKTAGNSNTDSYPALKKSSNTIRDVATIRIAGPDLNEDQDVPRRVRKYWIFQTGSNRDCWLRRATSWEDKRIPIISNYFLATVWPMSRIRWPSFVRNESFLLLPAWKIKFSQSVSDL